MHAGLISNTYEEMPPLDGKKKKKKIFIPLKKTKIKLSLQSTHNQSYLLIVLLRETEQVYVNFQK
jgi:hypothetical protein